MGEFEFIAKYLAQLCGPQALDLKDDVAVWTPPSGQDAVISMDTIVEGVHFPNGKFDVQVAQKLIRVNVSDIIAKGAAPLGYVLSLCLPNQVDEKQLAEFCKGLAKDQEKYGLKLWGGDTTRTNASCVLSLTIIGTLPHKKAILRSGAQVGDVLCVSGTIGDSYLGLQSLLGNIEEQNECWDAAYHLPKPPFKMCHQIREFASAALDISDGLIADATHLARASKIGLYIDLPKIPLSQETKQWMGRQKNHMDALIKLASGGDDYQVLMTIPKGKYDQALKQGINITEIGAATEELGVKCHDVNGERIKIPKSGYTHF